MFWSFIVVFLPLFCTCITVTKDGDGFVETYLSPVKFEGLTFSKRTINASLSTTVRFTVSQAQNLDALSNTWFLDGTKIVVSRIVGSDLPKGSVYSTEVKSASGDELQVTLHLTQKGYLPGNYTLTVKDADGSTGSASGFANSAPVLPQFSKPKRVLQGDTLRLVCHVTGYPKPETIMWSFSPIPTNLIDDEEALATALAQLTSLRINESHYVLETSSGGSVNDTLRFTELMNQDNGLYACNASTSLGSDFTLILVNVKDRWAALWPFIGIVIEVTVLVACILLYERHQMRSKPSNPSKNDVTTAMPDTSSPLPKMRNSSNNPMNNTPINPTDETENDANANNSFNVEIRDPKTDDLRLRTK